MLRWGVPRRRTVLHPGLRVTRHGVQRLSDADVRAILYPRSGRVSVAPQKAPARWR